MFVGNQVLGIAKLAFSELSFFIIIYCNFKDNNFWMSVVFCCKLYIQTQLS